MVRNPTVQYASLGGCLVVLVAILGWQMFSGERAPSPEELARQALEAASPDEQEVAAVRLAQLGKEAKEHLRRVLAESQSPPVRTACIQGLAAQWDYQSMPVFFDALNDESELVRVRAAVAVQRMLSADMEYFNYSYRDPPEKRQAAIELLRKRWKQLRDSPKLKRWKKRVEERS
jgi:hypothetical protein